MNNELDLKAIGIRIRTQRESLQLTREKMAEKLNVSSKFCSDIEYGSKGMSIKTLLKLSQILNLSTDYILKGFDCELNEIVADENFALRQSIMTPLNSCNRSQLIRAEQIIQIFVAAVNENNS